jgi:hypothetical protein
MDGFLDARLQRPKLRCRSSLIATENEDRQCHPLAATSLQSGPYMQTFGRDQIGVGAASAVMIFMTVSAIIIPYLYSDIRRVSHEG